MECHLEQLIFINKYFLDNFAKKAKKAIKKYHYFLLNIFLGSLSKPKSLIKIVKKDILENFYKSKNFKMKLIFKVIL